MHSHLLSIQVVSPILPTPPLGVDDYGNPWDDYPLTSDPEVAPSDVGLEASGVNPRDNYDHPRPATSAGPSMRVFACVCEARLRFDNFHQLSCFS